MVFRQLGQYARWGVLALGLATCEQEEEGEADAELGDTSVSSDASPSLSPRQGAQSAPSLEQLVGGLRTEEGKAFVITELVSNVSRLFKPYTPQEEALIERAIGFYEGRKQFQEAGRLAGRAGFTNRAVTLYEKVGSFEDAARLLEEVDPLKAASLYERAGKLEAAVNLLKGQGKKEEAVAVYERHRQFGDAAKTAEELGLYPRAMDLYLRDKDPENAARIAKEAFGDYERAIRIYLEHNRPFEAGKVAEQHLDWERALTIYQRERHGMGDAARVAFAMGDREKAEELYPRALQTGQEVARALLLSQSPLGFECERPCNYDLPPANVALLAQQLGHPEDAISLFQGARCPQDAANNAVKKGDRERALAILEASGCFAQAASKADAFGLADRARAYRAVIQTINEEQASSPHSLVVN